MRPLPLQSRMMNQRVSRVTSSQVASSSIYANSLDCFVSVSGVYIYIYCIEEVTIYIYCIEEVSHGFLAHNGSR